MDECRKQFVEWLATHDPRQFTPEAYQDQAYKWKAWQAAWNLRASPESEPVAEAVCDEHGYRIKLTGVAPIIGTKLYDHAAPCARCEEAERAEAVMAMKLGEALVKIGTLEEERDTLAECIGSNLIKAGMINQVSLTGPQLTQFLTEYFDTTAAENKIKLLNKKSLEYLLEISNLSKLLIDKETNE